MNHCDPSTCGYTQTIEQVVTWLLVIVGWVVVQKGTVGRARRQEQSEMVRDAEARIIQIRDLAITYYRSDPRSPAHDERTQAAQLKNLLKSLGSSIERLGYDLQSEMISFRKAVTSDPFEKRDRVRLDADHAVVHGLWDSADNFVTQLHAEFAKAHP